MMFPVGAGVAFLMAFSCRMVVGRQLRGVSDFLDGTDGNLGTLSTNGFCTNNFADDSRQANPVSVYDVQAPPEGWTAWPTGAMYQIVLDRFASTTEGPCTDLSKPCGGSFAGVIEKLDYLAELGVDGLLLSPVVKNMPDGYHGYWPQDLTLIEPNLGTPDDLKNLTADGHGRGMMFICDATVNHQGHSSVSRETQATEFYEMVPGLKPFNETSHYHPPNCSLWDAPDFEQPSIMLERCALFGLPDLNQENPFVWDTLQLWLRDHLTTYGFDAIRIDAARHINREFLADIQNHGPPVPAFHEVSRTDMAEVLPYRTGDLDSVYNYPLYFVLRDVFVADDYHRGPRQKRSMVDLEAYQSSVEPHGRVTINFIDNNDLPRFNQLVNDSSVLYRNALLYTLGTTGVPMLLYGSEQELRSPDETVYLDGYRPAQWLTGYSTEGATFQLISRTLALRKLLHGLHRFPQVTLHAEQDVMAFSRGPLTFVVGNGGITVAEGQTSPTPREFSLLNVPHGCSNMGTVCNVLAENIEASCVVTQTGVPFTVNMDDGEPKLYAPLPLLQRCWQQGLRQQGLGSFQCDNATVVS